MKIHFIAIGGSVMHQLAIALKKKGYQVSGSDDDLFEPALSNLLKAGIPPIVPGWDERRISSDLDAVILGMHAREDNPELCQARRLGIPVYSFPEYIYRESREKTRVVIGGSHGKTTITSMIMHVLKKARKNFDWLVGARVEGFEQSVHITDAPILICEGDEYPASAIEKRPKFHFFLPHIAVISGIAWDHINVFPSFDIYLEQFELFIRKIEKGGCLIYNATDPILVDHVNKFAGDIRILPYRLPEFHQQDQKTTVHFNGHGTALQVFGEHNLLNLQAARLVCLELGLDEEEFLRDISSFRGADKRLELIGKNEHSAIYRDFAHAPSKVKATVNAVSAQFPGKKLIAVLELHTYSSLNKTFLSQYEGALDAADLAAVYYSNHALEIKKLPDLSETDMIRGFQRNDLYIFNNLPSLQGFLKQQDYRNTVLLLMSSGNFDGLDYHELENELFH